MNTKELTKEIHENAVAHGWWDGERDFGEIAALIHSELSEALEEYRSGKPNVYFVCKDGFGACDAEDGAEKACYGKVLADAIGGTCKNREGKPEGIATELADAVIRILDYFGKIGYSFAAELNAIDPALEEDRAADYRSFGDFIANCHGDVSAAYDDLNGERNMYLEDCVIRIAIYCKENGIGLEGVIRTKHEYNKSRPYRHGGKKC